ncbi:cytidine deaminase [Hutsoniella sourekii]
MDRQVEELINAARKVRSLAYAPYSKFPVGAAIRMKDGQIIQGVNVENVSFGATNCAERSALYSSIAQGYAPKSTVAIAICGDTDAYLPPCSICRQVLVELCELETPVYLTRSDGEVLELTIADLVPYAFDSMEI